jgi:16S rRNA (guanine(966)-N(2))-methyltransferase RsmD
LVSLVRVIGGEFKRTALKGPGPKDMTIRPTYDRVRESVFDLIGHIAGLEILDLYAGTGSVGIEALSRGARKAVFVDKNPLSIGLINTNLEKIGIKDRAEVVRSEVGSYLKSARRASQADIVFIDPPYDSGLFGETMELLGTSGVLAEDAVVVGQHGKRPSADSIGRFSLRDVRKYGKTFISIWKRKGNE